MRSFRAATIAVLGLAATSAPPALAERGPTVAVEDTMHTEVPEVLVRAPRVTLDEILDRVAHGEARRESLITDQSYTATFRMMARTAEAARASELLEERVFRIYKKRPGRLRTVELRHYEKHADRDGANADVSFRADMSERIVNFAFRPEHRRDYRYRIAGRDLVGDHLVYRIEFEPRSNLGVGDPSGTVWVNTNEFVIVRQELRFDRSPVPLLIRGLERLVIERRRVDGHWVLHRMLARIRATVPLPRLGRSFDFAIALDQYAINTGLDDALFEPETGGRP